MKIRQTLALGKAAFSAIKGGNTDGLLSVASMLSSLINPEDLRSSIIDGLGSQLLFLKADCENKKLFLILLEADAQTLVKSWDISDDPLGGIMAILKSKIDENNAKIVKLESGDNTATP